MGGSIIFDHVQAKSELSNSEILVSHTCGGVNHLLTMCMLNFNFQSLGEILVCHTREEGSIIFDHVQAKSELSNSEILVSHTGGVSIIFDHV